MPERIYAYVQNRLIKEGIPEYILSLALTDPGNMLEGIVRFYSEEVRGSWDYEHLHGPAA